MGGGFTSLCCIHSLKWRRGATESVQHHNTAPVSSEVWYFNTGLTISKVIKQGLCPPLQLSLHTVSRLFILAQNQGNNVFPLYMFDRLRGVEGGAASGRFVISFFILFTSKELLRVLKIMNQSKHHVMSMQQRWRELRL